jgi:5-methylcytosine-specific restriction enzyme subunit McrC
VKPVRANKEITLFEFDCLVSDEAAFKAGYESSEYAHVQVVSGAAYGYLKSLCLSDDSENRLLQLRRRFNMEVLQVQNYAGVIFTPDKTQIEVLPKIGKSFKGEGTGKSERGYIKARQSLLIMLRALKGFSHIQTSSANIASQKIPLLEVFISQFLNSVNVLVKRGLRSDYVRREDNLAFLKGKLNVGKQLKHNYINKHKFYCEYDEFLLDRPANRLLHSALRKVKTISRSAANQKLLQELEFIFHEVPQSSDYKLDFTNVKLDRGMNYYQVPLAWCKLILEGLSPQSMKGESHAVSLLFPMEKVFEDYVAKVLKDQLAVTHPELTISSQVTGEYLARYDGRDKFSLRPDLVIKQGKANQIVLDTKWKLLDTKLSNSNISQSDIYQLFAYAKKYLGADTEGQDVVLIYPSQDNFSEPLSSPFELGDGHRLWIVPFEIINTELVGIRWPCKAQESNAVSIASKL